MLRFEYGNLSLKIKPLDWLDKDKAILEKSILTTVQTKMFSLVKSFFYDISPCVNTLCP